MNEFIKEEGIVTFTDFIEIFKKYFLQFLFSEYTSFNISLITLSSDFMAIL